MKRDIILGLAALVSLAACMPPEGMLVINGTGAPISLHVVKNNWRSGAKAPLEVDLAPGAKRFIYWHEFPERLVVTAGRCSHDYGGAETLGRLGVRYRLGVRLERDFSARLSSIDAIDGFEIGDALPHDPIRPVKTCR
jgi:chorismate synthase